MSSTKEPESHTLLYQLTDGRYWVVKTNSLSDLTIHVEKYPFDTTRCLIIPSPNITTYYHTLRIIPADKVYKINQQGTHKFYVCENLNILYSLLSIKEETDKVYQITQQGKHKFFVCENVNILYSLLTEFNEKDKIIDLKSKEIVSDRKHDNITRLNAITYDNFYYCKTCTRAIVTQRNDGVWQCCI